MHILIDYENVGNPGLNGTQFLCKEDVVTLFYSGSCTHIDKKHIEMFENETESFEAIKLRTAGKNGLDFYIAVRVGQIIENNANSKILIVTRDGGFMAVSEFCKFYTHSKHIVSIQKDIESGIVSLDGNTARKKEILSNRVRIPIEAEYIAYKKRDMMRKDTTERLRDSGYEQYTDRIMEIIENSQALRSRYLSLLKALGRNDGVKVYRLIRDLVRDN